MQCGRIGWSDYGWSLLVQVSSEHCKTIMSSPEVQIMCILFMNKQLNMYKMQFELNACALLLKPTFGS